MTVPLIGVLPPLTLYPVVHASLYFLITDTVFSCVDQYDGAVFSAYYLATLGQH